MEIGICDLGFGIWDLEIGILAHPEGCAYKTTG
jgi:hypothetical protein